MLKLPTNNLKCFCDILHKHLVQKWFSFFRAHREEMLAGLRRRQGCADGAATHPSLKFGENVGAIAKNLGLAI